MLEKKENKFSVITPEVKNLGTICKKKCAIPKHLYDEYNVNIGLRDKDGNGVLTGLTEISDVMGSKMEKGKKIFVEGELKYRGINIEDLVDGFINDDRFGFEEVTYLLIAGSLPGEKEFEDFKELINHYRSLPPSFVRDIIMKAPSTDVMNMMARSVLTMYSYDDNPDDISINNVLRQCLQLIAAFPMFAVYSYQAYKHYLQGGSLFIHSTEKELSTAENILMMLRDDRKNIRQERLERGGN